MYSMRYKTGARAECRLVEPHLGTCTLGDSFFVALHMTVKGHEMAMAIDLGVTDNFRE